MTKTDKNHRILQSKVELDNPAKENLLWWIHGLARLNGKPMTAIEPDLIIFSDACLTGWGAGLNDSAARGPLDFPGFDPSHQSARVTGSPACPGVVREQSFVNLDMCHDG